MSYRQDHLRLVREEYEKKAMQAEAEAEKRRVELEDAIPEVRALDAALSKLGPEIFQIAMRGGNIPSAMQELRAKNNALQEKRAALLLKNGFPADYDDPKYDCPVCRDVGFVKGEMCGCMRRRLIEVGMQSSGLSGLMKKQSFENFSLDYYRYDPKIFGEMSRVLAAAKEFAEEFGSPNATAKNLLLVGGSGIGKTHISTAIARRVIERGYDVLYNSAVGMLSDFETLRFGTGVAQGDTSNVARYTECDLLILDDLGTEVVNQFSLSCLYHVVNTRLNQELPTIISTNLPPAEISKIYTDRIASRLFGEYNILLFRGRDIRQQKN